MKEKQDMEMWNLVELLKDCPKGTKLYSATFGNCTLMEVQQDAYYPIKLNVYEPGEKYPQVAMVRTASRLFPAKNHRTWEDWDEYKVNCLPKPPRPTTYKEACEVLKMTCDENAHPWAQLAILGKAWNKVDGVVFAKTSPRNYPVLSNKDSIRVHLSFAYEFEGVPALFKDKQTAIEFGEMFKNLYLELCKEYI